MILLFMFTSTSFFASQFSSLPMRVNSVFSNPAGLGLQSAYEAVVDYHPDRITTGLATRYFSAAMRRADSLYYWEAAVGYKLPGVFSIGYAFRFGEINEHVLGVIGLVSDELSVGYKTRIGDDWHMLGGAAIKPLADYLVFCGDVEHETIYRTTNYHAGVMVQPLSGLNIYFRTDHDFRWSAGLQMSFGKFILAAAYAESNSKISVGGLISSETYPTFLIREERIPDLFE